MTMQLRIWYIRLY